MNEPQDPVPPAEPAAPQSSNVPPASSRSKWIILGACAIAIALFAVPLIKRHAPPMRFDTPRAEGARAGCAASQGPAKLDFTVKDMNGRRVKLADYKGKVILLNFWATWCGPCKLEIPEFVELYDQYKDRGFVILGMLTDDTPSAQDLQAFITENKMKYPILYSQDDVADAYGPIYGIPMSFFIGRDGSICLKHMGPATRAELEQTLKSLL